MTYKWENRDRKITKKRSLKEMNAAHRMYDSDEAEKREKERRKAKANKLKSEIEELFGES